MTAQLRIDQNANSFRCEGILDIRTAAELRSVLASTARAEAEILLDLSGISDCDVSGVQLLYAAGQCAKAQGQRLSITAASTSVETISAAIGLPIDQFFKRSLQLV